MTAFSHSGDVGSASLGRPEQIQGSSPAAMFSGGSGGTAATPLAEAAERVNDAKRATATTTRSTAAKSRACLRARPTLSACSAHLIRRANQDLVDRDVTRAGHHVENRI